MATLTPEQIYQVCLQAGFTPDQAVTWTAIALAESGGRSDAHNPHGEDSWGLWQINVNPAVRDNIWGDLTDPVNNARAALAISGNGTNLRPWTVTHASNEGTNKDYRQYMEEARAAAGGQYQGYFGGVTGYDDPNPGGSPDPAPDPPAQPPPVAAPAPAGPAPNVGPDADSDGLSDPFEMSIGTDPLRADTDMDGLTDGFEYLLGTNPLALDSDGDGLSDGFEVQIRSNPLSADTDADGVPDDLEVAEGRSPGFGAAAGADGLDSDGDGLSDASEIALRLDPHRADTDVDGVPDDHELMDGTNPLDADTDNDGFVDRMEQDTAESIGLDVGPLASEGTGLGQFGPPGGLGQFGPPGMLGSQGPGGFGPLGAVPPALPTIGAYGAPGAPIGPMAPAGGAMTAVVPGATAPGAAPVPAPPDTASQDLQTFLDRALAQTGDPYVWASEAEVSDADPDKFDCSELVQWAAGQVGVEMPDGSWLQYLKLKEQGLVIPVEDAANTPGALLFSFSSEPTPGGGRPGSAHVAISLGDGNTIEARGTRYGVGSWEIGDRFDYAAVLPGFNGVTPSGAAPETATAAFAATAAGPDTDADGASDPYEMASGTDWQLADTDRDGLTDGFEFTIHTDALKIDTDGDALSDGWEVRRHGDALVADVDADGTTDDLDVGAGESLGGPRHQQSMFDTRGLEDGDGLSADLEEAMGTDAYSADTDHDGLTDDIEYAMGSDPLDDGIPGN